MVSFNCDACQDVVKKPKLDQHHNQRCGASFTCLDCSLTFYAPMEWKGHTSCVSEAQKYERSVYRGEKGKGTVQTPNQAQSKRKQSEPEAEAEPQPTSSTAAKETQSKKDKKRNKKAKTEAEAAPAAGSEPPQPPATATGTLLQARILALVSGCSTPLTLAQALKKMSQSEGKEEKKLRKEILKGVQVNVDGTLSWV